MVECDEQFGYGLDGLYPASDYRDLFDATVMQRAALPAEVRAELDGVPGEVRVTCRLGFRWTRIVLSGIHLYFRGPLRPTDQQHRSRK